jgi:hypothetical protein
MKSKKTHGGSKIKDHAKIEVVSIAINWADRNGLNGRKEKDLSMKNEQSQQIYSNHRENIKTTEWNI